MSKLGLPYVPSTLVWTNTPLSTQPTAGDPKKSITLLWVSGGTWVFAKQQNRHIFRFPMKN